MSEVVQDLIDMIRREPNGSGSNEDWLMNDEGDEYLICRITTEEEKSILNKLPTNAPTNTPSIHNQNSYQRGSSHQLQKFLWFVIRDHSIVH